MSWIDQNTCGFENTNMSRIRTTELVYIQHGGGAPSFNYTKGKHEIQDRFSKIKLASYKEKQRKTLSLLFPRTCSKC